MRNKKNNAQNCQLKLRADCSLDSAYAWLIANQYAAEGGKTVTSACGSPCLLLWTIEAEKQFYVSII